MARPETGYNIGVVGATGLVGSEFLNILETRQQPEMPIGSLRLFASERSAGETIIFRGKKHVVEKASPDPDLFRGLDFVLTAIGDDVAKIYSPVIVEAGALNVDKSNAWRMNPNVPLVVPEVNPNDAKDHKGIIAGPNCSTTQMVVVLWPIHQENPIKRIIVDTYQAVSGTGRKAVEELQKQLEAFVEGKPLPRSVYPYEIFGNAIPEIGSLGDNGRYSEELKIADETRKIMHMPDLPINATCVRIPVFNGHSEAVHIELTYEMFPSEATAILLKSPGVKILDDPGDSIYPTALDVSGKDDVFVGRIRWGDLSQKKNLSMWIVGDNLRKGAALNAIQVFELVARNN
ncbi:MAG: aspartate-semialdehyde dehydrogenase [Candidatus Levybacteria bacterium]|nr:aspartate-semialdehyde dehydrogenase [Candidatus Levybacteria bacterium]